VVYSHHNKRAEIKPAAGFGSKVKVFTTAAEAEPAISDTAPLLLLRLRKE
jgi:hypothetical protein